MRQSSRSGMQAYPVANGPISDIQAGGGMRMLRTEGAREWTAEQHEAAAAALGSLAAALIKLPGYGSDVPVGYAMNTAADQIVRWAAIDAASHAYAAMVERDKQSRFLEQQAAAAEQLFNVCAWCPKDKQLPVPTGATVTHGICDECKARELRALD